MVTLQSHRERAALAAACATPSRWRGSWRQSPACPPCRRTADRPSPCRCCCGRMRRDHTCGVHNQVELRTVHDLVERGTVQELEGAWCAHCRVCGKMQMDRMVTYWKRQRCYDARDVFLSIAVSPPSPVYAAAVLQPKRKRPSLRNLAIWPHLVCEAAGSWPCAGRQAACCSLAQRGDASAGPPPAPRSAPLAAVEGVGGPLTEGLRRCAEPSWLRGAACPDARLLAGPASGLADRGLPAGASLT